MFTILPALYTIGLSYFRAWKTPYDDESVDTDANHVQPAAADTDANPTIPSRTKRHDRRRRKTSINDLSYDDITYLIRKTGFTREEIIAWYEEFLRDCPDGKLPKSKVIEIYQQFYRKGRVEKFCEHAFGLFNKDGSGHMDFIEFLLAVSMTASKDPARKVKLFFAMYDMDHNGLIDGNEMRAVVESIYQLMGVDISDPSRIDAKVSELLSKVHCDQLGNLNKEQFAIACEHDRHIRKFLKANAKAADQT